MGSINKKWHLANKMPQNPTVDQRMRWHLQHANYCTCRTLSEKLKKELAQWEHHKGCNKYR